MTASAAPAEGAGHVAAEVRAIVDAATAKYEREFALTDAGNAERFVARHGTSVRFVHGWGRWLIWDGTRWALDERGEMRGLMLEAVRSMLVEAAGAGEADLAKRLSKHAIVSERRDRIMAALDLASSLPPAATVPEDLDRDPDVLNVANGTIALRSGRLRQHDPARLCTKIVPVAFDPAATAPTWEKFLERSLPDPEVRAYVQRAAGYSATGHVTEHVLFFNHGGGANGKSTFLETKREALGEGEYAKSAQPDLLLAKRQERHAVELADLRGMRFVSTVEAGEGRAWDEARVKWLTGGDTIAARLMYGNPFSFTPTHKFWIAANHKPRVGGTDTGFWRRVHLIPWTVTIPEAERDRDLRAKLRAELPGILRWIVEGAIEWHRSGLRPPPAVLAATKEYRQDEDVIGAFLEERCTTEPGARVDAASLYATFRAWAEANGERQMTARAFGEALDEREFKRTKSNSRRWFVGVALRHGGDHAD
jgi:putative DNA primase/helicase